MNIGREICCIYLLINVFSVHSYASRRRRCWWLEPRVTKCCCKFFWLLDSCSSHFVLLFSSYIYYYICIPISGLWILFVLLETVAFEILYHFKYCRFHFQVHPDVKSFSTCYFHISCKFLNFYGYASRMLWFLGASTSNAVKPIRLPKTGCLF